MTCSGIHTRYGLKEPQRFACERCRQEFFALVGPTPRVCRDCADRLGECSQCGAKLAQRDQEAEA